MKQNENNAFRSDIDSAAIFNSDPVNNSAMDVESWDDALKGFFEEPLEAPRNTTMAIRRTLPPFHEDNFTDMVFNIPHFFTTDDSYGERWAFILIDLGEKNVDWQFLAIKPNPIALLEFLAGKQPLSYVYENTPTDQFYIARPNVSDRLLRIDPYEEFPQGAIARDDFRYNDNIFLDLNDPEYGYNTADANNVMKLAKAGKFYYR